MHRLLFLILLLTFSLLGGCAYAPKDDPNNHDLDTHDMRTGGVYTPATHEKNNGWSFFKGFGEIFTGERKIVW